jgi:hypothetical protein
MSKANKKVAREAAIKAEKERREAERLSRSPVSRDQMISLVSSVGAHIAEHGHESNFKQTDIWLVENGIDVDEMHQFLNGIKIQDDWSLLMDGDPYQLFGSTESRKTWMPLEENELTTLLNYVDDLVQKEGCKHDHQHTKNWLAQTNYDQNIVIAALMAHGGFCDCEVAMNIEEDSIY